MREARVSIVNTRSRPHEHEATADIMSRARAHIDKVSRDRPDLILLSEIFANHPAKQGREAAFEAAQAVPGPISEELSALARKHSTYIAFGLLRKDGEKLFNSLVMLDREGSHVWTFDKVTPMAVEMEETSISPGKSPTAFDCGFARVGAAICFDINFLELAEIYFRQEIELLLFASAFPAGRLLDHWAVRYGFAVAGGTWYDRNRIIDCTGATVARTSEIIPYATAVMNLNRRVVHMDGNIDKLDRMRSQYKGDVLVEDMREEAVAVITSLKPGLEVSKLITEFEVETLPDYFDRSRRSRAKHGGLSSSPPYEGGAGGGQRSGAPPPGSMVASRIRRAPQYLGP